VSHFVSIKTKVRDRLALVRALVRMGFSKDQIEVCDAAREMSDYYGGKKMANVIIRSRHSGIPSDIGFEKSKDGVYVAHVDEYKYSGGTHYNAAWQKKLYTYYGVEKAKMELDKQGHKIGVNYFEDVDEKERPRLRVRL